MGIKEVVLAAGLMLAAITAKAQTALPTQSFGTWLSQQQAHAGVGYFVEGDKAKYATTWWDLVQFGKGYGVNVAQPSNSMDYVDIGPANAVANGRSARWGVAVPIHAGNIWNNIKLSSSVQSHVNQTPLPAFVVAPSFMVPQNAPLSKWQWKNFMVNFSYGFGGS